MKFSVNGQEFEVLGGKAGGSWFWHRDTYEDGVTESEYFPTAVEAQQDAIRYAGEL